MKETQRNEAKWENSEDRHITEEISFLLKIYTYTAKTPREVFPCLKNFPVKIPLNNC